MRWVKTRRVGLNNAQITKEEVKVMEMKAGLDGCAVGCLKSDSTSVNI